MQTLGSPSWFGQYRLSARVATGGMAEVYVGRHITPDGQFGPMVAVKRLLPHLVKDVSIVRMFLNEARITAQITHPNVVRIFELGQQDGEPFIAMELLDGRTYADLRARAAEDGKRMPLGVALAILAQACRGLDAAHNAIGEDGQPLSLVHRDFTPDNIHVGVNGEVKVIDFGIAKTASWGSGTEPGTLKGKFFYMSPEMILGKNVDHRADLFAAGVMLYEQLCGRRPFTGNSVDEVVMKIAEGKLQPPSSFDPSVPRELEAVCLTALNKNPDSRFPSLGVFVDAMEALGGESQLATHDQIGAYVSQLFPASTDDRRSSIRRAREADPSVPGAKAEELSEQPLPNRQMTAVTPLRAEKSNAATERAIPAYSPTPKAPTGEVPTTPVTVPPGSSGQAPAHAPSARKPLMPIIAGAAVLIIAAAAYFLLGRGTLSAQELLAAAEAAPEGPARVKALKAAAKAQDLSDAQLSRVAELLTATKQWDVALEAVEGWLLKDPKNVDVRLLEAHAAIGLKRGKRAEAALDAAQQNAKPDDPRPDLVMAELRELQGDARGQVDALARASKKRPDDVKLIIKQGVLLSQLGRLDDALDVLGPLVKKQFDPEAAAELGFVRYRQEKPDEALKLLQRAVKEKPDLMVGHYYLAAVEYQKGDVKGARAEYAEADKLAGADTRPLVAWCELEKQQEAAAELDAVKKRLKERFPTEADALIAKCAQ